MAFVQILTSFNISITFPAASFGRRLLAWLIDFAILLAYCYILDKISDFIGGGGGENRRGLMLLLLVVPTFLYHPLFELFFNGQSPGKRMMSLRVISDKGGRPSISQVIIRWLIRTSDIMMVALVVLIPFIAVQPSILSDLLIAFCLFILDLILVNVTSRHQRLGDLLAHTMVIGTQQSTGIEETIFQNVRDTYQPQYPQVLQLSDRDINAIKNILDSARKHHDYDLAERASEKIKRHLGIQTSMSPYDFLEILLKDYNYLTTH